MNKETSEVSSQNSSNVSDVAMRVFNIYDNLRTTNATIQDVLYSNKIQSDAGTRKFLDRLGKVYRGKRRMVDGHSFNNLHVLKNNFGYITYDAFI